MNPERWQRVKQLLDEAISIEPGARSSFLERACVGDTDLRREVDSLLSSHEQAGTAFLKAPAVDLKAAVTSLSATGGRRIGVYQMVEEIGRGGMGEVYRAVRADGQYTKEVAIKLVRGGFDSRVVLERFRTERQILASLDHPNIARLLDGGTTDGGIPYLVMELIEGEPIDEYCDANKLSVTERLRLFRQVCLAVHYAHQRLVIHRDIKPSNVLVTKEGSPKLLDFGIAKIVSPIADEQTTLTMAMTPEYASPEQIRGEPITTATDVYSLGVVLYQLLTGQSPYAGDTTTPHKLAQAVCETQPGKPSTVVVRRAPGIKGQENTTQHVIKTGEGSPEKLRKRLAGDLDDIVLMALRKEPSRRYGSVEQFAEDIGRHLEGLPVVAAKGSWRYRAEKFVQRHKVAITAAAVVALAIAGGVGATIREARIAAANARRAETRFNDVRHLANSLIFDVEKSIADLPGSTPARKLLVDDALQYLDTLAKESKDDISLQRELAAAYLKLGGIQGNPFLPNLGESAAALASYRKSLAIRHAIAEANPDNKEDQAALAYCHEWLGVMLLTITGNAKDALAEENAALAIMEPLAKNDPANLKTLGQLRGVYESMGDIYGGNGASANLGDTDSALEYHRKSQAIAERIRRDKPDDKSAGQGVAVSYFKTAGDLVKKGDRATALDYFKRALDILKSLDQSSNTPYARNISIMYQNIGNILMMDGNSVSALENYRQQLEIARKLVERDPKNATARIDEAYTLPFVGIAEAESGNVPQGLADLQSGIELLEKESEHDPKKSILHRYVSIASLFRGQVLFKSGKVEGALSDFKKMASIHETIVAANPSDADSQIDLAAANVKIADVLVLRGDSPTAIEMYKKSLAIVEPLAHSSHPSLQAQYTAADAYSGLGLAFQKQTAGSAPGPGGQVDSWKQGCSWLEQSLAEWQRVPNPGRFSPNGFESEGPNRVAAELSSCQAQLKNLKQRADGTRSSNR